MGIGAALGIGGSVLSGVIGAKGAKSAAKSQAASAQSQLALQRDQFNQTQENLAPFLGAGENALGAYLFELGLGPAPTFGGTAPEIQEIAGQAFGNPSTGRQAFSAEGGANSIGFGGGGGGVGPSRFQVGDQFFDTRDAAQTFADANPTGGTTFNGIQASPAALFALEQGRDTIEAGAAGRGGLNSGATLAGLEKLRFGLSAQDRDNQLNRFAGLIDSGQGAAGQQAVAGNAFAVQGSNSLAQMGNAQSAGAIGKANAFQGALSNIAGVAGFQGGGQSGGNSFGDLFSLFGGSAPGSANSLEL